MRTLKLLFIGAAFSILALPGICTIYPIVRDLPLHGVEHAKPQQFPALSIRSFFGESFQRHLAEWMDEHIGLRGIMVRTENQLNFSLFNEISSDYGSPLIVGTHDTLIEKLYVDLANGHHQPRGKRVRVLAKRISHLSKMMRSIGIPLIVMLTPSKVSLDPAIVPKRFLRPSAIPGGESAGYLKELLVERHVAVLDTKELLAARKNVLPGPLFARGGTHWTVYSACHVVDALLSHLGALKHLALTRPVCDPPQIEQSPRPFDRDLADLANIWFPEVFFDPLPYPPARPAAEPQQLRLMFIGGSFLWTVFDIFESQKLYSEREMLYYFRRRFSFPAMTEKPMKKGKIDWTKEIRRFDAVILEINEAHVDSAGGGFVGEAHKSLSRELGSVLAAPQGAVPPALSNSAPQAPNATAPQAPNVTAPQAPNVTAPQATK